MLTHEMVAAIALCLALVVVLALIVRERQEEHDGR